MFKINSDSIKIFFKRFLILLLISLIPIIWIIQEDSRVQQYAKSELTKILQKEWNAQIKIESSDLNLFTGIVILKNGFVKSKKDEKSWWSFKRADVKFSRISYFFNKELILKIRIRDINFQSSLENNKLKIIDHFKDVLAPNPEFIVDLRSIKINNLKLNVIDEQNQKKYFLDFLGSFNFKKIEFDLTQEFFWHGFLNLREGTLFINEKLFLDQIKGRSSFYQQDTVNENFNFKINKSFYCFNNQFTLIGEWGIFHKYINLKNKDNFLDIKISSTVKDRIDLKGEASIEFAKNIYTFFDEQSLDWKITGSCVLNACLNISNDVSSFGKIETKNLKLGEMFGGKCNINFEQRGNEIKTNFYTDLSIPGFDQNAKVKGIALFKDSKLQGKYDLSFLPTDYNRINRFNGNYFLSGNTLNVSGKTKNGSYVLSGKFKPEFYLTKLLYQGNGGERLIDINLLKNSNRLRGKIKFIFLKSFLPKDISRNIFGKSGNLFFDLEQNGYKSFSGSVEFGGGRLSFLGNYNPLHLIKFDFDLNFLSKEIFLKNLLIKFFKGTVKSYKASINLKDNYEINLIHFPLKISDMLINFKKDFYGIIYGDLLFSKKLLSGDLVLKRSLFRKSEFSGQQLGDSFFDSDSIINQDKVFEFDIKLSNEKPLKLKTSFIHSNADLDLSFHSFYFDNKLIMPQIIGSIDLQKGVLNFLRYQLYIHHGKIDFAPNQPNEPHIDLFAQNRIKKYLISLQATGSLQHPIIVLESFPQLSEEQILALLMSGSENTTLQADLPAIFMQNLNELVMSEREALPKGSDFIRKISLPLKYVQITPNFTNQAGYGGIKGIVSINLNNQIHAQVQKTFNVQEDFAFQIEYLLTDDINLKFVRDQSGEIGSEVEVRFRL